MEADDPGRDGAVPRYGSEEELGVARDLRAARESLVATFLELPAGCRGFVLDGNTSRRWNAERLEACFERLVELEAKMSDPVVSRCLADGARFKERLRRARDLLVHANLGLVPHVVKDFYTGAIPLRDLVQDGFIGLLKAIDRFDPERGIRLSTYAYWWIRRALNDAFSYHARLIRLPDSARRDVRKIRRASSRLERTLSRPPTEAELADRVNMPLKKVKKLMELVRDPVSIEDLKLDEDYQAELRDGDTPDPFDETLRGELRVLLAEALDFLAPRERAVIRMRFGFVDGVTRTLRQIAEQTDLTRERVRQIECEALRKMGRWMRRNRVLM